MRIIRRSDENEKIGLSFRPFIEDDLQWHDMELLLTQLFSGKRPEFFRWSPSNKLKQLLKAKRWIVKFVIMNRLLPWMIKNFLTQSPILILRHPCSCIVSKIRFSDPVKNIEEDDRIYVYEKIPSLKKFIDRLNTPEEFIALSWCIDTIVPLLSKYKDSFIILTYERLVTEGEKELEKIYEKLHLKGYEYSIKNLKVPSKTTGNWSVNHRNATIKERLSQWKNDLDSDRIKRIMNVLNAFEIKFYSEDLEPDYSLICKTYTS